MSLAGQGHDTSEKISISCVAFRLRCKSGRIQCATIITRVNTGPANDILNIFSISVRDLQKIETHPANRFGLQGSSIPYTIIVGAGRVVIEYMFHWAGPSVFPSPNGTLQGGYLQRMQMYSLFAQALCETDCCGRVVHSLHCGKRHS